LKKFGWCFNPPLSLQPANEKSGSSSKGFQGNSPIKNQYFFIIEFEKNLKKKFRKKLVEMQIPLPLHSVQKTGNKNNKSSLKDWKQQQRFK
jgi:hypothetical protein